MRECSCEVLLDLETDEMPDGPTIGAADGGRHGLPGGTATAHEPAAASARLTDGVPRLAGPAITQLCATAHRGERRFAACAPGTRGALPHASRRRCWLHGGAARGLARASSVAGRSGGDGARFCLRL